MILKKIHYCVLAFISTVIIMCSAHAQTGNDNTGYDVFFPINEYLAITDTAPYPVLIEKKFERINTKDFVNVMNFGAAGDGVKNDNAAIIAAFAACKPGGGVLFPKGKTFLTGDLIRIPLKAGITVYAYGAVFKMSAKTGYNAIAFETNSPGFLGQVIWLGGTFDGNKDNQSWPGSPTGDNKWMPTQGNYGLLTIRGAEFALVKDVTVANSVYDGIELFECKLGVIADSKGHDGVPLNYADIQADFEKGKQATYFKATRTGSQVAYFLNLTCTGGSIGVQYSAKPVNDSSLALVANSRFYNQAQDAIHFEVCRKVFVYNSIVHADNTITYHPDVHISNNCLVAVIQNNRFENGRIDFRTANLLKAGIVKNCRFTSSAANAGDTSGAVTFIKNATHVVKCSFDGFTRVEQVTARYVDQCDFKNFGVALNNVKVASNCTFNNGKTTLTSTRGRTLLSGCTFGNVTDKAEKMASFQSLNAGDERLKVVQPAKINAVDVNGRYLSKLNE